MRGEERGGRGGKEGGREKREEEEETEVGIHRQFDTAAPPL